MMFTISFEQSNIPDLDKRRMCPWQPWDTNAIELQVITNGTYYWYIQCNRKSGWHLCGENYQTLDIVQIAQSGVVHFYNNEHLKQTVKTHVTAVWPQIENLCRIIEVVSCQRDNKTGLQSIVHSNKSGMSRNCTSEWQYLATAIFQRDISATKGFNPANDHGAKK